MMQESSIFGMNAEQLPKNICLEKIRILWCLGMSKKLKVFTFGHCIWFARRKKQQNARNNDFLQWWSTTCRRQQVAYSALGTFHFEHQLVDSIIDPDTLHFLSCWQGVGPLSEGTTLVIIEPPQDADTTNDQMNHIVAILAISFLVNVVSFEC